MKTTAGGKAIAPVVDIMPQLCVSVHDHGRIREEMALLKQLGFDRIYFVLCQPGYPMFSNPWLSLMSNDPAVENHMLASLTALGDPNWAYVQECHKQGMEAWAVIKPYEGGGGSTIPHGAVAPMSVAHVETVGGRQIHLDALLGSRPDLRVKRRPDPRSAAAAAEPITGLELAFCLDAFQLRTGYQAFVDVPETADGDARPPALDLWLSRDNGRYERFAGAVNVSARIERRDIRDANGALVASDRRCLVVAVDGLNIEPAYRYIAVTLQSDGRMYTIPFSMIQAFSPSGALPITIGRHARAPVRPDAHVWGHEKMPVLGEAALNHFPTFGFEFEWHGSGFWGPGWSDSPVYGIARGTYEYMKGAPCEAYPEVRDYWLEQTDRALAMGFDGVDFRLQNHSQMVSDYVNYGYNEPIVEAYKARHGIDMLEQEADPLEIMRIRGDFFLQFMEEASRRIRASGKKVQIHLRHSFEEPRLSPEWSEIGFWAMPKVLPDWRKLVDLADEVTLKHYYHNDYRPELARRIKDYASGQGKRVWVHCYIAQCRELNDTFFDAVERDPQVGGVLLYETAHSSKNEKNHGLIEQYLPPGYHEPTVGTLRSILDRLNYHST